MLTTEDRLIPLTFVQEEGNLKKEKAPDSLKIQELEAQGLAITYGGKGVQKYGTTWGIGRMNNFLRTQLPALFQVLARDNPWILTVGDRDTSEDEELGEWPYILLVKKGRNLAPTPSREVTGPRVFQNRGRDGVSAAQSCLWIGESSLNPARYSYLLISISATKKTIKPAKVASAFNVIKSGKDISVLDDPVAAARNIDLASDAEDIASDGNVMVTSKEFIRDRKGKGKAIPRIKDLDNSEAEGRYSQNKYRH